MSSAGGHSRETALFAVAVGSLVIGGLLGLAGHPGGAGPDP